MPERLSFLIDLVEKFRDDFDIVTELIESLGCLLYTSQAICRTNRKYNVAKKCGLLVDFVGVFDNVAKSLAFDEETVKTVVKNIDEIKRCV